MLTTTKTTGQPSSEKDNYWEIIIWTRTGGPSSGQLLEDNHLHNYWGTIICTTTGVPSSGLDNYRSTFLWTTTGGPSSGQLLEYHHLDNYWRTII
jgi:hypothetical protein